MEDDAAPEMLWPLGVPAALDEKEIQVWCWSLCGEVSEVEEFCGELAAGERARAGRFVFRRDWRRYVMAHAGMRRVLGACLGRRGDEIAFRQGTNGKPYLAGEEGVGFNLTHSGNVAVLAVGRTPEVGVDVERVREEHAAFGVEQLSRRERAWLEEMGAEERGRAFCRCWTGKEALLKGIGLGLTGELDVFSLLPGWERAELSPGAGAEVRRLAEWRVRELVPAVGYVGCVAMPGDKFGVCCLQLG